MQKYTTFTYLQAFQIRATGQLLHVKQKLTENEISLVTFLLFIISLLYAYHYCIYFLKMHLLLLLFQCCCYCTLESQGIKVSICVDFTLIPGKKRDPKSTDNLLFPGLNSPSSLSISSCQIRASLFITFIALSWTHSNKPMYFFCWGAQNWTQNSRCSLTKC